MIGNESEAQLFCTKLCDQLAMSRLGRYIERLSHANKTQNLVAAKSFTTIWQRHIADSLQLLRFAPADSGPWLDLGTGAGAPGLLIAIARPRTKTILVESRKRRVEWLREVIRAFNLDHCEVRGTTLEAAEEFAAAVISARAFASLTQVFRLAARFATLDTVWILPKGRSAAQQLSEQPTGIKRMFHVEQSLTAVDAGIIVGQGRPGVE